MQPFSSRFRRAKPPPLRALHKPMHYPGTRKLLCRPLTKRGANEELALFRLAVYRRLASGDWNPCPLPPGAQVHRCCTAGDVKAWALFGGPRIWKIALLLLAMAHVALLLLPRTVLSWNASRGRLYFLEALLFAAAVAVVIGLAKIVWRHLGHSNRSAIAELSDSVFLGLLLVGTLSGILLAIFYRWGSSWGAMILTPYVASLARLEPDAAFAAQLPFLVRLHVFSAFAAVAVLR